MNIAMVDLGMSYDDFMRLTAYEVASQHNHKIMSNKVHYINIRNAFLNAYCNANRSPKEKFNPLFSDIEGGRKAKKKKKMSREEIMQDREDFFKMLEGLGEI